MFQFPKVQTVSAWKMLTGDGLGWQSSVGIESNVPVSEGSDSVSMEDVDW